MQVRRLIVLLLVLGLLIGVTFLDPVNQAVGEALEWAQQIIRDHQVLGLALFCVLSALSAIVFFLSTAVIVPVAVHTWGVPMTIGLLWGSWLLGAVGSYVLGRVPGRSVVKWLAPSGRARQYEK